MSLPNGIGGTYGFRAAQRKGHARVRALAVTVLPEVWMRKLDHVRDTMNWRTGNLVAGRRLSDAAPVRDGWFGWSPESVGVTEVTARPFRKAVGFVDWNTAIIASGAAIRTKRAELVAQKALGHVERVLSNHLSDSGAGAKFRVQLRLYAGWHRGKTPTTYLQGIVKVLGAYASRTRQYHDNRVIFEAGHDGIQLGNRLALVSSRVVPKHGVHFLDTLRRRGGACEEKMADTALAVDLFGLASRRAADRYVVVSDDDDMLPGLFAAEATGADARMLSRPGKSSRFMAHARDIVHTY